MPYLTSFEAQKTEHTYRCIVQLASNQLDHEGVPETVKTVDVVVLEPTETAIRVLIAACGWLDGYMIVAHWVPSDCTEF